MNRHQFSAQFEVLENKDRSGLDAFTMGDMKKMELDLNLIRNQTKPYMVKTSGLFSDTYYDLTPDEEFFMSGMAPACHSDYISNSYHLNMNVKYVGCHCGGDLPTQKIPLTILPRVNMATYGFEAPDGYAP